MGLLEDKVCLITGAGRGIGYATLKRFLEEGAVVYANYRSPGTEEKLKTETDKYSDRLIPICFDVNDESVLVKKIMQIKKEHGRLDVLVNNAGIMSSSVIGMISRKEMQEVFDTNVFGTMNMIQVCSKLMKRQKSGSIINISSIVGEDGASGQMVYSASKGAVISITKTAAKELAAFGIRVNAVSPGMIKTDMLNGMDLSEDSEYLKQISMKRFGAPDEVGDAIVFLASDMSGYITGQILGVNGGARF